MLVQYLLDNLLAILVAVGGAIGWMFDRRNQRANYEKLLIDNKGADIGTIETMRQTLKSISEDVNSRLSEMRSEVQALRDENRGLEDKISRLEGELSEARSERDALLVEIDNFREQSRLDSEVIGQLKVKIDKYEKELRLYRKERML